MLRTPDESAGKKAKCPQCSTIVDVPQEMATDEPSPPSPAETPESHVLGSSPFSAPTAGDTAFTDSTPPPKPAGATDSANPYAPPSMDAIKPDNYGKSTDARPGLPWERDGKSTRSFRATAKLIIGSPTSAFLQMRREGGLGDPILYGMAGGLVGNLAAAVYTSVLQGGMFAFMGMAGAGQTGPEQGGMMVGMAAIQIVMNFVQAIIAGTVGVLIGMFINAGITHLFLMLFKGANQPFETTFRVSGFVTGATSLFNLIPLVGWLATVITSIIYTILGLAAAHDTTTGKTAAAVFVPMLLCCVLIGVPMIGVIFWLVQRGNF